MIDLTLIIIIALVLIIVYLIFTRRKKYSLNQIKDLIRTADWEIQEAHKRMRISHGKLSELYKAILSIEQGRVKQDD